MPLPPGIADIALSENEAAAVEGLRDLHNWDRLLFSVKEAIFKLRSQLGVPAVIEIARVHPNGRIETATRGAGVRIDARWTAARGLLVTAVTARPPEEPRIDFTLTEGVDRNVC